MSLESPEEIDERLVCTAAECAKLGEIGVVQIAQALNAIVVQGTPPAELRRLRDSHRDGLKIAFLKLVAGRLLDEADDAYQPAHIIRHPRFCPNHKALIRILKSAAIRIRRPRPNRLQVHVGDWVEYLRARGVVDPYDLPSGEADTSLFLASVREQRRRLAAARAKKTGRA